MRVGDKTVKLQIVSLGREGNMEEWGQANTEQVLCWWRESWGVSSSDG